MRTLASSPIPSLAGSFVMLTWPWVFFGIVWVRHGVQLPVNNATSFIIDNPHITNYIVTFIGTIVSLVVGFLLSSAVTRLGQQQFLKYPVTVFHVIVLSAFKNHSWPWNMNDSLTHLFNPNTSLIVILIGACVVAFTTVTSSTTSLITPVTFIRTVPLQGTELDFSSNDTACIDWLNTTLRTFATVGGCSWQKFNGLEYSNCLAENQLVDVLEAGRNNMFSLLPNHPQIIAFSQLGGLRFSAPMSGVLPLGPDGVPGFDTVHSSPLSDAKAKSAMISYNYTLQNQGFTSNVSCVYDNESPIFFENAIDSDSPVDYKGSCNRLGQINFLQYPLGTVDDYSTVNPDLTFWACKNETSYFLYLRGSLYYGWLENITCTVSPIQPAIFPVTYQSVPGTFSLRKEIATSPTTYSGIIDHAVVTLGNVIQEAAGSTSNTVADSVFTFGAKFFDLPPNTNTPESLMLFATMIQGILDYEATYIRLIYSMNVTRPSSCDRTVNGTLSYETLGWSVKFENIWLLLPMTIINLVSFLFLLTSMSIGGPGDNAVDPTDPRQLIYSTYLINDTHNSGWKDKVMFPGRVVEPKVPLTDFGAKDSPGGNDFVPLIF